MTDESYHAGAASEQAVTLYNRPWRTTACEPYRKLPSTTPA